MSALVKEMPRHEQPLSEQYRIAAKCWCDADAAATVLEELKSATLEQKKSDLIADNPSMSEAKAERLAKITDDWEEYVRQMCTARAQANVLKAELKVIEMRHREWIAGDANARHERRLVEMHP
jgi:hypothetical protein